MSTTLIIFTSMLISVRMDNIVQCLPDVIKCYIPLIFIRTVNIMQRRPDLIKLTSRVVLACPGDIIQRRPDIIKVKSPVIFRKAGKHYAKATGHYKAQKY